jgi:hypothetical protein
MECFFAIVGLLLAGTIAAFLQYVSSWPVLTVFLVFLGMLLTFLLGVFVGSGHALPWHQRQFSNSSADALAGSAMTDRGIRDTRKPQSQTEILTFRR